MHFLYQLIVSIILFIVAPHYVLVALVNYMYRPRLAQMIYNFHQEKLATFNIKKSFYLSRFFE